MLLKKLAMYNTSHAHIIPNAGQIDWEAIDELH